MYGVTLECWGDYACFTRPEMKVERVSYDVVTPSAARGILEAIYWKPEIRWAIDHIKVLNPIRFVSMRRNEVASKISASTAKAAMKSGKALGLYVEEDRQQRATLLLRDVKYQIHAKVEVISGDDNANKHLEMFRRRARKGQCFTRPYLGCREFAADFRLVEEGETTDSVSHSLVGEKDLGWMLQDIDFAAGMEAKFFRAKMVDGVVEVPPFHRAGVER